MQRPITLSFVGLFGILVLVAGCGEDKMPAASCTPQAQVTCTCADPTMMGVALCQTDGTPGVCSNCATATAGTFGNGTSGTGAGTGTAGVTAGTGTAGVTAGTGTAGVTAGTGTAGVTAGTGTAGTTAGTGAAGTMAGTGAAGTGAGPGCTAPDTCVTALIGGVKFCAAAGSFLPSTADCAGKTMGAACGVSGGSCIDGAAFGMGGTLFCVKACT